MTPEINEEKAKVHQLCDFLASGDYLRIRFKICTGFVVIIACAIIQGFTILANAINRATEKK